MSLFNSKPLVPPRRPLTSTLSPEGARGKFRNAVEFCERRIDESVIGIETVEHRTVFPDQIDNEPDRFLEHGLPKVAIEGRETFAVNRVVFLKAAEIKPMPAKLLSEIPDPRILDHAARLNSERLGMKDSR